MRMNFAQDATAKIEGLLAVNREFLQAADCAKFAADIAAELCGIALAGHFFHGFVSRAAKPVFRSCLY